VTFLDVRVREAGKGAVIQLREIVATRDGKSKFDRDGLYCVPSTPEGTGIDAIDATSAHRTGRNLRLSSALRRERRVEASLPAADRVPLGFDMPDEKDLLEPPASLCHDVTPLPSSHPQTPATVRSNSARTWVRRAESTPQPAPSTPVRHYRTAPSEHQTHDLARVILFTSSVVETPSTTGANETRPANAVMRSAPTTSASR